MYADNIGSNVFWTALASSIKLWTLNFSLRNHSLTVLDAFNVISKLISRK